MTSPRSDPSALKLGPFPAAESGIHRVSCLRPVTLEPAYTTVSSDDTPTVILQHPLAVKHRARLQAEARARAEKRTATVRSACWLGAACLVAWFAARVIAELVPVVEPAYFTIFVVVAVFGFGFLAVLDGE